MAQWKVKFFEMFHKGGAEVVAAEYWESDVNFVIFRNEAGEKVTAFNKRGVLAVERLAEEG
jgi:hypothetical protein